MITASFQNRNFIGWKVVPNHIDLSVRRYKNRALGGPNTAELYVTGADLQLWELLEFLRCPVFLTGEKGDYVWWGYVSEVEVIARNPYSTKPVRLRVGTNLDRMYNKVAVAWEDIAVGEYGGKRYTTDYASDTTSQAEYGVKEGLFSGESASDQTLAEQTRDILLAQKKYPVPNIDLNVSGVSEAYIRCRGWWDTLNWLYCPVPAELALSFGVPYTEQAVGTVAVEQVAQGIVPSGGDINLAQAQVYIRTVGAPADNVTIGIYTNPDGVTPTALIQAGATIAAGTLSGTYIYATSAFSPEVTLTSGTPYFLVVGRSGDPDDVNYYQVAVDPAAGYGAGNFVRYDGANWTTASLDMLFQLYDNVKVLTSTQVLNILTTYGQFFGVVESEVNSGVTSESYRDGDGTAHFEVEQLLQHGTTNKRRMLAKVDSGRRCTIYEEPANTPVNYYRIYADGTMEDPYGAPLRDELATCGVYARLVDAIPPSVDTTILGNAFIRFVEETEYDVEAGRLQYTARDDLDPFTVGRPLDG